MKHMSISLKLTLLAGIPVLGALILALQIVRDAQIQVQMNKSLGTIEHVARLSETMGKLVNGLQKERAFAARIQGQRARSVVVAADSVDAELANPAGGKATATDATREAFRRQSESTASAQRNLNALLSQQVIERLPERLAFDVRLATDSLRDLQAHRAQVTDSNLSLVQTTDQYQRPIRALIEGIAALSELTDNGELLRLTTSLVSVMQLKERGSQEHALLAYVFELGRFPPGSYRAFVTLVTEEGMYLEAFKTTASSEQVQLYNKSIARDTLDRSRKLRTEALENTEDRLTVDPDAWFNVQQEKLLQIASVESELHGRVGAVAMKRIAETRRAEWTSALLVGAVILTSVLLAWIVARGVTRRITALRDVALQVGHGNLAIRVAATTGDELGALGKSFNEMIGEIGRARSALSNQIRMSRELEIAASLQRALLPPAPAHPDFDFAGRMQPADEMCGDFYDVLRDGSESNMWVTIGDVSGHGLRAGLVMLMTQSAVASQFRASSTARPSHALMNVNRMLCENIAERLKDKKYVTAQIFAYMGQGRFLCAGAHQPTIVYRAQSERCDVVEVRGPWLGIDPAIVDVPETQIELAPGDILCLYTDGLHEARNAKGELFDLPRLVSLIENIAKQCNDLDEIAESVFRSVGEFAPIPDDDRTMLLVRRRGVVSQQLS